MDQDVELKTLVMLEAHRMREVARNEPGRAGYARFVRMVDEAIARAKRTGYFSGEVAALPLRSAIVGMVESGVRQQVMASRANFPASYGSEEY